MVYTVSHIIAMVPFLNVIVKYFFFGPDLLGHDVREHPLHMIYCVAFFIIIRKFIQLQRPTINDQLKFLFFQFAVMNMYFFAVQYALIKLLSKDREAQKNKQNSNVIDVV